MSKVWFITGCSTGFGKLLCQQLLDQGHKIVATARVVDQLDDLKSPRGDDCLRLPLDVTRNAQIQSAVAAALQRFSRIDVLVNNAGYGYFATQEEGCLDEIRRLMETNVIGLVQVTQAVLPAMRAQRSGVVMNLSSVAGRVAFPRAGFYNASKWAVEALSESLHFEVVPFGIRVVVIEPGAYATDFAKRSAVRAPELTSPDSPYAGAAQRWTDVAAELMPDRQDPIEVVDGMIAAAEGTESFVRIPIGKDANRLIGERYNSSEVDFIQTMTRRYNGP